MSEREPPDWGSDPLSQFFKDADYNARVTAANYPLVFDLLGRAYLALERAEEAVEKDSEWVRLVPRFLLVRTRSVFLSAIRAGMSGQVTEAFILLRAAIEQSWYALYMASGPNAESRVETWLRRNESPEATAKCKAEFTIKNVRSTHEEIDPAAADELYRLYESLVDYGAHPNQMGVFTAVKSHESGSQVDFKVGILYPAQLPVMVTLRFAVAVAVGALKVFQRMFPERFAIMGLDSEIKQLVNELNSRFKPYKSPGPNVTV